MKKGIEPPYKHLTPFKRCVLQNFPFIEADFDALTNYGLLCKIVEYLNKVIASQNEVQTNVETLNNAFIELKNYVDNYFDNLDVQEEINNKLDEMVESGEFQELVGEYIDYKVDYYEITDQTEEKVAEILSSDRASVIVFRNDYTFTSTKSLGRNKTIDLGGNTITFDIPDVSTDYHLSHGFFNFESTDSFTGYAGKGNITITNGVIEGGNCSFCHAENITFKGIHFLNCKNNHILEMCAISNLVVDTCKFEGIPYGSSGEYVQNDRATYNAFPWFEEDSETYDGTPCRSITIRNSLFVEPSDRNYIHNKSIGTHTESAGEENTTKNIKIQNCTFINPTIYAIQFYNVDGLEIDTCTFKGVNDAEGVIHVRLRSGVVNTTIRNCYFNGMTRAIEMAREHLDTKNVKIDNNIFENYNNATYSTYAVITVWNPIQIDIVNNTFKDFIQNCITSKKDENYDTTIKHILNVKSNLFTPLHNKNGTIVRLECGYNYVRDNEFDLYGVTYGSTGNDRFVLATSTCDNMFFTGNQVSKEYLGVRACYDKVYDSTTNTGGFVNVYDLPIQRGTYDVTSIDIPPTEYVLPTNFNTIMLNLGEDDNTQVIILKDKSADGAITPRTWNFPIVKADGTLGVATLEVTNTDHLIYSGDIKIHVVKFMNSL